MDTFLCLTVCHKVFKYSNQKFRKIYFLKRALKQTLEKQEKPKRQKHFSHGLVISSKNYYRLKEETA